MARKLAQSTVGVSVDMKPFDKAMSAIEARLKKLVVPKTIKILGDVSSVSKGLDAVMRRARGMKSVKVEFQANTKPIDAVLKRLTRVKDIKIKVDADTRGLDRALDRASARAGGVTRRVGGGGGGGGGGRAGGRVGFGLGLGGGASLGAGIGLSPGMIGAAGLGAAVSKTIRDASSLQTLMVGLRKATDQDEQGFGRLKESIYGLSTEIKGVSLEDLIRIATTGAKMGIAAGDLREYTKGVAMISAAIDDMPAAEIAEEIGKLNSVFKLGVQGGMQLGSAIDKVADSGVSSAKDILNVTQRLSGAATVAKVTAQETIALSGALLDTGTRAELASSSISHLLLKINNVKSQAGFAKALGVSMGSFAELVRNEPMVAITQFLDALKKMDAGSQGRALAAIGIKGDQGAAEIMKLAQQVDQVRIYAGMANSEFKTLNQITMSYGLTAETADAATASFQNQIKILSDKIGTSLLPVYTKAMEVVGTWAASLTESWSTVEIGVQALYDRFLKLPEAIESFVGSEMMGKIYAFAELFGGYLAEEVETMGRVIRNLPDYFDIVAIQVGAVFANIGVGIETMIENFARLGNYVATNWYTLLKDAFNGIGALVGNLGKNLWNLGKAFLDFLSNPTKGLNFDWTPLMDGFKAESAKLPAMMEPRFINVQAEVAERLEAINVKELARQKVKVDKVAADGGAKVQAAANGNAAAVAGAGNFEDDSKKKKGVQMSGLTEYYANLQAGVFGKKDPTQEGIKDGVLRVAGGIQDLRADLRKAAKPGLAVAAGPA